MNSSQQQKKVFEFMPREELRQLSKQAQRKFHERNSLDSMDPDQLEKFTIEMKIIEKVLNGSEINLDIPNYINGRSTQVNSQIILVALWIHIKGFMELDELHEAVKCYESGVKTAAKE